MMRKVKFILFTLVLILISCSEKPVKEIQEIAIIPQPAELEILSGTFKVTSATQIVFDKELQEEATYASKVLGLPIKAETSTESSQSIFLIVDPTIKESEGYALAVNNEGIHIHGAEPRGVFYGLQTLRQLFPADWDGSFSKNEELLIPFLKIVDQPRFSYRGMHLDVGRHFFGVEKIKAYLDLIAFHKMNTFHWHLTEDQGWRIEIKKYPKLTEVGGYRKGTAIGLAGTRNAPYTYDTIKYGGFYTQEEVKEVVDYARKRHITVIPEIELPGHSSAALAAYPEFGNTGGPYEVAKRWGIFKEVFSPTEETFAFLEDVLTEVIELFPSEYIHIGGDEVLKDEWKESAYAQELIKKESLEDEHGLQSYFIRRIETFLNAKGRQIIGWDEILEGGLAPNATVMSWRGEKGGVAAAKMGHKVIMTPITHCYFDLYQIDSSKQHLEPITGSKKFITTKKVYHYEPIPKELSLAEAKYVLGAQGNVWTEYMPEWERVEYKILPRMSALSEVVWSPAESKDWNSFKKRMERMRQFYENQGLSYASYMFDDAD